MEFKDWLDVENDPVVVLITPLINEISSTSARYSVEVNYRSKLDEILDGAAKIIMGYVSAAMKQNDFHVKQVYDKKPLRVIVSSRNWDDGEWVGVVTYNPQHQCFVIGKGFYNRDRATVSLQSHKKCSGDDAAEITRELRNLMHSTRGLPDRHAEKLKPVPLKRGPR